MIRPAYRDRLEQLEITQLGAAGLLGVDERTSRRWANPPPNAGEGAPHAVMLLLAVMRRLELTPRDVEAIYQDTD